jgi:hypothetical protein
MVLAPMYDVVSLLGEAVIDPVEMHVQGFGAALFDVPLVIMVVEALLV